MWGIAELAALGIVVVATVVDVTATVLVSVARYKQAVEEAKRAEKHPGVVVRLDDVRAHLNERRGGRGGPL